MHRRALSRLAAKWNIDRETAVFELLAFEHDVEDARRGALKSSRLRSARSRSTAFSKRAESRRLTESAPDRWARSGGARLAAWDQSSHDTAARDVRNRGRGQGDSGIGYANIRFPVWLETWTSMSPRSVAGRAGIGVPQSLARSRFVNSLARPAWILAWKICTLGTLNASAAGSGTGCRRS